MIKQPTKEDIIKNNNGHDFLKMEIFVRLLLKKNNFIKLYRYCGTRIISKSFVTKKGLEINRTLILTQL